jgi:hypothetical protein
MMNDSELTQTWQEVILLPTSQADVNHTPSTVFHHVERLESFRWNKNCAVGPCIDFDSDAIN